MVPLYLSIGWMLYGFIWFYMLSYDIDMNCISFWYEFYMLVALCFIRCLYDYGMI